MVLRVYDVAGNLIHDCAALGCTSSWDGYDVKTGDPVPSRVDPDPAVWRIYGETARER